jgi:hypothetical protein
MSVLLNDYKGHGHCVTMDSAYMGDIMAQLGHDEWKINMVGMAQLNRMGANVKDFIDKLKIGTYESHFWQHESLNLVFAAWLDNAIVKTLWNHHGLDVLQAASGLMWRGKDNSVSREMKQKLVPCPAQTKEHCETFHLIDKGNGKEAKYNMARKSWSHNWAPKLVFCMFNMAMNNAYIVYKDLIGWEGNGRECLKMGHAVQESAHDLCQQGTALRMHAANHPAHL